MKKLINSIVVFSTLLSVSGFAQVVIDTTNPIQFGVYGHIGKNWQSTGGFSQLGSFTKPYAPFSDGEGDLVMFGGEVNSPLSSIFKATNTTAAFHLGIRFGFDVYKANMTASEKTTIIQNGQPVEGTLKYNLRANFSSYGFEPMVEFTPPFYKPLRLHAGVKFAYVYKANFNQTEAIEQPSGVEYLQGGSLRTVYEDQIPNHTPWQVYSLVGLTYNIKLNKRFALVPELFYQLPMNNLATDQQWNAKFVRAGLSIRVTLPTSKPVIRDTIIKRDTVTRAVPDLAAERVELLSQDFRTVINENDDVRYEFVQRTEKFQHLIQKAKPIEMAQLQMQVYRYKPDSSYVQLDSLNCREIVWNDFHPLLNYVFFEYGSSQLIGRYSLLRPEDAANYKLRADQTQMETYYNMMNILSKGLLLDKTSKIDIVGCMSKKELAELPNATQIARERATAVANYFKNTWGIEESRINIKSGSVPQKPSNEKSREGQEENQRVEIYSSNEALLQPVMIRDTMLESAVDRLRIANMIKSETPILSWRIWGEQEGRTIFSANGEGQPKEFMDIALERSTMRRLMRKEHSTFKISMAIDQQGKGMIEKSVSIPITVEQIEKLKKQNLLTEVDRFILMLFDFGKDDITAANENIIKFIKKRIDTASAVSIIGTTDRYGQLAFNLKLSERRANSVYKVLGIPDATAFGLGPDTISYDNDLPEGRFHARTVRIEVEHRHGLSLMMDR